MPATKKQILRIELLDELLQHKWKGAELLSELNNRILEYGDIIDKRTLYRDINYLIEEKAAPIHRPAKGDLYYYYYESFSLKKMPLDEDDVAALKSAINILSQVDNFSILAEIGPIINKLENQLHIGSSPGKPIVQFEKHTSSTGHEYFKDLYDAITTESVIKVDYQPFTDGKPSEKIVHPYLLKEFRNRWFLFGREGSNNKITIYALDRIKKIKNSNLDFIANDLFEPEAYFNNMIGVSADYSAKPEIMQVKIFKQSAPYVKTKPIHHKQVILKEYKDGSLLIQLELIINNELKSVLLGYGERLQVLSPKSLKYEFMEIIKKMNTYY